MRVRDAVDDDMARCRDLYNALIETTTVAWTDEHQTLAERRQWFADQRRGGYPVKVAENASGVVGFAAYGSFRGAGKWPGYRFTVEHTIHVAQDHWGTGIGRALMHALITEAKASRRHAMVGAVDGDNIDSIRFHEQLGFVEVARMPEVGRKFDRWLDLVFMELLLEPEGGFIPLRSGTRSVPVDR